MTSIRPPSETDIDLWVNLIELHTQGNESAFALLCSAHGLKPGNVSTAIARAKVVSKDDTPPKSFARRSIARHDHKLMDDFMAIIVEKAKAKRKNR